MRITAQLDVRGSRVGLLGLALSVLAAVGFGLAGSALTSKSIAFALIVGTLVVAGLPVSAILCIASLVSEKAKLPALLGLVLPVIVFGRALKLYAIMGTYLLFSLLSLIAVALVVFLVGYRLGRGAGRRFERPREEKPHSHLSNLALIGLLLLVFAATAVFTKAGRGKETSSIAFSADGRWMAIGQDESVELLDARSWEEKLTLHAEGEVSQVSFSPDSRLLAIASDREGLVWSIEGNKRNPLPKCQSFCSGVAFSPDGRLIALVDNNVIWLIETSSWHVESSIPNVGEFVEKLTFAPDGKRLAWSEGIRVMVAELGSGRPPNVLAGHTQGVSDISFSNDGRWLATASLDSTIKIWDPVASTTSQTLTGHKAAVWSIAFSRDGRWLASSSEDRSVKLWEVGSWREVRTLPGHGGRGFVAFAVAGNLLASAGKVDNIIYLWDPSSGRLVREMTSR